MASGKDVVAEKEMQSGSGSGGQATFCKLRSNHLKKARKLATLYDAEIALIGFSSAGSLFDSYAGSRSMQEIIQDYLHSHAGKPLGPPVCSPFPDFQDEEIGRLKDKVQLLEMEESEDVKEMKFLYVKEELEKLESKLECRLKSVRQKKELLIAKQKKKLENKEQELQKENESLRKELVGLMRTHEWKRSSSACSDQDTPQLFGIQENMVGDSHETVVVSPHHLGV